MNIVVVPKKDIDTVWPHVKDYLDKAAKLSLGRFTIEEIKHLLNEVVNENTLFVGVNNIFYNNFLVNSINMFRTFKPGFSKSVFKIKI